MNTRILSILALVTMGGSLAAQVVGSSATVTSPLTSNGYNCWTQAGWNQAVPVGPLGPGVTSMPGVTWNLGASSLSASASGSGGLCSFWTPPSSFSASGAEAVRRTPDPPAWGRGSRTIHRVAPTEIDGL